MAWKTSWKYFFPLQVQKADINRHDEDDEADIDRYLRRLDAGLYTLQLADYIISELCVCGIASIKSRIKTILGQREESLVTVRRVMEEYWEQTQEDEEWKKRIQFLINELHVDI